MNGYPYPQRSFANGGNMVDMSGDGLDAYDMNQGQSLDDIVSQNDKDRRRSSMPTGAYRGDAPINFVGPTSPNARRFSQMNFGDPNNTVMEDFQFNMNTSAGLQGMMRGNTFPQTSTELPGDRTPVTDLAINTQFSNATSPYPNMPAPGSAYASPMNTGLDMDMTSPYPAMSLPLDMPDSLQMMPTDLNMFANPQFPSPLVTSSDAQDFVVPAPAPPANPNVSSLQPPDPFRSESSSATPDARSHDPSRSNSQEQVSQRSTSRPQSERQQSFGDPSQMSRRSLQNQQPTMLPTEHHVNPEVMSQIKFPWRAPPGGFPSIKDSNPHTKTQYKNAYSSTGFDMLGVLMRVASRPNPQIDIGSVDLSCAFVVCDYELDDVPIVYCSENFERLTGYSKHMILGRNCRFLQSPDGKVEPGVKRRYCDDDSVYYLKDTVENRQEAQMSLINYRRGGQPFMNLLTMIPIPWEEGGPMKFIVGFQVDLVEQPGSMTNKNPDGTYRVNYQRGISMPSYVFTDHKSHGEHHGHTISKDEVSNVLATYGSTGDSEITRRIWDKILLENTDDVVHVLSLKGLFLYLSPSSSRILEYDPSELVGTALSSVCHPSDIVPVTRELKDMSNGSSVNVVFRIRRKNSGYMWFEGHGSLHTEQGKGRKCIILVGRERPVYTLSKTIVRASGGVGDNELWTKLSTSGMFLFVSSNVRSLLDKQPDDMVGTSIQSLMRQESKSNFGRILELARTGRKGEVKHELINKRGQVLQAFTTIYPGDAIEGQKPTFLVAQTRLLKYSRNSAGHRPSMYNSKDRSSDGLSHVSLGSGVSPLHASVASANKSTTTNEPRFTPTEVSATTFSGQNGLRIGHQDHSLASEDNIFDELKTTRSTSWQYELRQMEKRNRYLAEEVQSLLAAKKKRKRRKGAGHAQKDCANCHTRTTPEWRRGPSGNRDLCNSCGLRWAKQQGRVSPRTSSQTSDKSKKSASPRHNQTILPNIMSEAIPEAAQEAEQENKMQIGLVSRPVQPSPHHQQSNHDAHAAKVPRTATAQDISASIPSKIDEGIKPD